MSCDMIERPEAGVMDGSTSHWNAKGVQQLPEARGASRGPTWQASREHGLPGP